MFIFGLRCVTAEHRTYQSNNSLKNSILVINQTLKLVSENAPAKRHFEFYRALITTLNQEKSYTDLKFEITFEEKGVNT